MFMCLRLQKILYNCPPQGPPTKEWLRKRFTKNFLQPTEPKWCKQKLTRLWDFPLQIVIWVQIHFSKNRSAHSRAKTRPRGENNSIQKSKLKHVLPTVLFFKVFLFTCPIAHVMKSQKWHLLFWKLASLPEKKQISWSKGASLEKAIFAATNRHCNASESIHCMWV